VMAFQRGCAGVLPVPTPEAARAARGRPEGADALLCGEQGGLPIPGFDLANSPSALAAAPLRGRRLILCTSNGTPALAALRGVPQVWIGALRNAAAVAAALAAGQGDAVLACSGKDGSFCLEDAVCAGAVCHALRAGAAGPVVVSDAADAAELLFRHHRHDLLGMLRGAEWGRRLEALGLLEDLRLCAELDAAPLAPALRDGHITL